MKKKLYLICPDCNLEENIRREFGNHTYCLTALGSVFNISDFTYAEEINHLLNREGISDICVVNAIHCSFLANAITQKENYNTRPEKVLRELYESNLDRFDSLRLSQQQKILARLNIYRQVKELIRTPIIGNKIREHSINVSGLMYDRTDQSFERLSFNI